MKKYLLGIVSAALLATVAHAQSVQQSGSVTPNTSPIWSGTGIIKGGNTASDSPLTTFGVTRDAADAICVSSARQSAAGRNQLCLQAATSGPGKISLQNYGTATAQDLQFVINGTAVTIPTGGTNFVQANGVLVSGHMPCWSGTVGIVVDCGVGAGAGTQFGLAYYSAAGTIGSTAAGTDGQLPIGQTGAVPLWKTLSGDVGSLSAAGALTLQSVNGVPFSSSYTAHGVLIAQGSSAFTSSTTANVGYCLLSQGTSSDPTWASCASGSGSAGGANTQVQFNNSTSLGGSANLTWVSPALTIGVAGTTTGQLQLAPAGAAGGTVTIQNPSTASGYNFNLPISAGGVGQPLVSGGGGSTAMSFATLGIVGGGTNCSVATGTCLDNITGFSSTGFVQRTGAGTYAFSTVIPVSGGGTNLASGTSGGILYYSGSGTLASTATLTQYGALYGGGLGGSPAATSAGTDGQVLLATTSAAPGFASLSGDITTVTNAGVVTIANSAISNAKLANAAAYTLKGNFAGSAAAPTDTTIGSLTNKASPAAGDYLLIVDNAAAGQMKYASVSSVASAGSVSSIDGATGAFTTNNGITSTANVIQLTSAVRTLPTVQQYTSGSGTYTTPANVQWIRVRAVGGGGGGAGSGGGSPGTGGTGGDSTFGTTVCVGSGGTGGNPVSDAAGVGGSGTSSAGTVVALAKAGAGGPASSAASGGGIGGSSFYGGGGTGGRPGAADPGLAGATNTGGGGGGATAATTAEAGGGAGGYCEIIINGPSASYGYSVGAAGAAGSAGTSGAAGGAGGSGVIVVEEYYNS